MTGAKHLSEPCFSLVATGKKVYEGRLGNNSMAASASVGTQIVFYNDDLGRRRETKVAMMGKRKFASFRAVLESSAGALAKTLPTIASVDDGVAVYRAFYSAESEKQHGVVRLRLRETQKITDIDGI